MCGIVGCASLNTIDLDTMLNSISHRGPDNTGKIQFTTDFGYNIQLGHRRLSIIDSTLNSNQPFLSQNKKVCIVFNGEIYNFKYLKNKYLENFNFTSTGDTEVIVELYAKYGVKSFNWLKGMFAFVLYDISNSKIILCRDGLGIKPLYYYFVNNELYFSSEIKAIKKNSTLDFTVCKDSITEFFLNGFLYEPNTGYININKIYPGSYLEFKITNNITINKTIYWRPPLKNVTSSKSKNLQNKIKSEFINHLVSDVPIGLFYSGGIDSSLLLLLSDSSIKPYFINTKANSKNSNELDYATKIANNLKKDFTVIEQSSIKTPLEILNNIKNVAINSEELIADYTYFASEKISKVAQKNNKKVMLSGMGADELFLGYPRYKLVKYFRFYKILFKLFKPLIKLDKNFSKKFYRLQSFFEKKSFILRYTNLIGYYHENELDNLLQHFSYNSILTYESKLSNLLNNYENYSKTRKAQILDIYGFLSHNFMVCDKSSMQASVEVRLPLATTDLLEYSFLNKEENLLNFFNSKIPLLKILNEKISLNFFKRAKEGFNPDLEDLIKTIGQDQIYNMFKIGKITDYIKGEYVLKLLNEHFTFKRNNTYKIYQLIYFKFWIEYNT
jgi:asparagine synthase (glutamine-hydrolysing)